MFLVGYASEEEIEELKFRGWDIEPAEDYGLVGRGDQFLMEGPKEKDKKAIVVFADASLFDVMSGPDWDK